MKNEVMEIIAKIRKSKGRLDLLVVSGKQRYSRYKPGVTVSAKNRQRQLQN